MRLIKLLRSRRLAVLLLIGLTVYSWIATWAAPGSGRIASAVASVPVMAAFMNAVGLNRPFSSPIFLAAVALVTLSTAACAWERTRLALRSLTRRTFTPARHERTIRSPQFVVQADAAVLGGRLASEVTATALRRLRLKTLASDGLVVGTGGFLGLAGSALFHWALVGVFVFAALGQLTRYEGYANVIQGRSIRDSATGYDAELTHGALFGGRFSGLTLGVADINLDYHAGGVARGNAALVTLSNTSGELKRQWVYPDSPLRFGSLFVHRAVCNAVFLGSVRTDGSSAPRQVTLFYDLTARASQEFPLVDLTTGKTSTVVVAPMGGRRVEVSVKNDSRGATQTAGVGGTVEVLKGQRLTVDALTYSAQLHVVNDRSVPWLYAMFVLGSLCAAAAVLVPTRTVWVAIADGEADQSRDGAVGPTTLYVRYSHRRNDPAFPRLLEQTLRQGVAGRQLIKRKDSA